jgi:Flp pilus assembly protein TadB
VRALIPAAVVLLVAWFLAVVAFKVTVAAIHLVLVAAVILFVLSFLRGRSAGRRTTV